jgi:acyl-CoA thioester hydrolase
MKDLLKDYPIVIEIAVAWGEMDVFQHVNHTVYYQYFESGRVAYCERIGFMKYLEGTDIGLIITSQNCKFKAPVAYPDRLSVGTRVAKMEGYRMEFQQRAVNQNTGKIAVEGSAVIVTFDFKQEKAVPVPQSMRERIQELEGKKP